MPKGNPPISNPHIDPVVKFNSGYVTVPESGCWIWMGNHTRGGYPVLPIAPKVGGYAHRFSYELHKGPIPDGLTIDHLCCVPLCVNPDHLEAVTSSENVRRAAERMTHCRRGHLRTQDTLRIDVKGGLQCRVCDRVRHENRRLKEYASGKRVQQGPRKATMQKFYWRAIHE